MIKGEFNIASKDGFRGGFTILMAVYRRDDVVLFERALQSVYSNTLLPDAFVLVVDGPIPDELDNAIKRQKIRYGMRVLYLPVNLGLAQALNEGLMHVRTKWVVRADADDYNLSDRFALQAAATRTNESIDLLGGAILEVDSNGKQLGVRRTVELHSDIRLYSVYRNPFNHMTVAYRTELALRCGGYPDIELKEDYALWATMLASGAYAHNLANILVRATAGREMYRRRSGLRYARSEISLQNHLVRTGLKSPQKALLHGLGRATIFLLPSVIRGWIYERLLRDRPAHPNLEQG